MGQLSKKVQDLESIKAMGQKNRTRIHWKNKNKSYTKEFFNAI
jgi:hypothetical protein